MACLLLLPLPCLAGLHDTKYDHLFQTYSRVYLAEYDWRWLKAQAYQESRYNPAAVSPVGATGLMQIMPGTGRDLARRTGITGPLTSPLVSVIYGAVYDRQMLNIWSSPRLPNERLELAHASYNSGAGHVIKAQRLANGHALWSVISQYMVLVTGRHSEETISYVALIKKWYHSLTKEEVI